MKGFKMNSFIKFVCLPLMIIGALNWGLVGAFNFNLVSLLFGTGVLARIIYLLVGIAGICSLYIYKEAKDMEKYSK